MIGRPCIVLLLLGSALLACAQPSAESVTQIEQLIRARQYPQALLAIRSGLRATPADARLWTLEGIALSLEGKNPDAVVAFEHALKLAPDNLAALRGEAELLDQGHDRRALPLLRRIVLLAPGDQTAHEMLGNLEEQAGNCPAALHDFEQSGAALKQHPESLVAWGACLDQTNQSQQAIAVFQQLADDFPQLAFAKYDLALTLFEARQYAAAEKAVEPLATSDAADPDVLSLASDIDEAAGDTPQAVALLRQAIVLQPDNANLYNAFALLCLDHDSFQVGIDMIDAGLRRIPGEPSLYLSRGLLYVQLSQFDKAEADFETAERLNPRQSMASYAIDVAELQKNNFDPKHSDRAVAEIRSQIRLHPDSAMLQYLLAKLLSTQSSDGAKSTLTEAKAAGEAAVRLRPNFVEAHDMLANIYLTSGEYSKAAEQCRISLHYDPSDRSALYHLMTALRHSDKPSDRAELQTLIRRLSELEKTSLEQETSRKKFHLVEVPPPAGQPLAR